ncbi:conserved hypothetical protein (hypothetical surface-anchored protein) [Alteracholeplasma palmae J233]|uniref:ATPase dynein-related AAA domain-containing protein n=1 Tax=Alteracholeplasma palmae (strain ATCC 49389 / J233) TaxID=1318466 RepID=U4KPP4_ALTPJ|nr:hypothetical protein [Alteracholeplasma palmae]CCV64250.1 conserved hypothetical protein (hypothetical surface-anchored protein) [Alteracholeplasma palmae J233]
MEHFSQWFIEFFKKLSQDLWALLSGFFKGIYNLFIGNPINYFKDFNVQSKNFTAGDWALSIMFITIFFVVVVLLLLVIYQIIKRYIRFTKIEQDKIDLLHRQHQLELRLKNGSIQAKNSSIFNSNPKSKKEAQNKKGNRFVKLSNIDEKYKYSVLATPMLEEEKLSLPQLVTRFRNYSAYEHKLFYTEKTIAIFLAGMATSKTMILEGISGTGKTSLPYAFGKFISHDSSIISVQPSWRDRFEMMGYLNEFTKKFNETEFLRSVYESLYRTDINLIVLDEMNLARVEYYFADFLSLLELPNPDEWLLDLIPEQIVGDPVQLKEGKIKIAQNIWFIGTANKDDSTFAITDKVYDRAASIEMNDKAQRFDAPETKAMNLSFDYLQNLFTQAEQNHFISPSNLDALVKLDTYITEKFEITFGNRIMKQLNTFVPVFMACGQEEVTGIDYIIARKIIRKFETLNLPFLQKELQDLLLLCDKLFGKDKLIETKKLVNKFLRQV